MLNMIFLHGGWLECFQHVEHDADLHACMHACAQGRVGLALELLTALGEECCALERKRRTAVMPILVRRSAEVLGLVSGALTGKLGPGDDASLCFSSRPDVLQAAGIGP
jgi:hypothetical protein